MATYKDFRRIGSDGTNYKWSRITTEDAPGITDKAIKSGSQGVFLTVQTYFSETAREDEDEICDFFCDFDGDQNPEVKKGKDPVPLALEDLRQTISFFTKAGLDADYFKCWFSGNRGFHFFIPREMFGAQAMPNMFQVWRVLANSVKRSLDLQTLDERVYNRRRQWRVENSKHGTSGLYKIPLTVDDIKELSAEEIKKLAKQQQPAHFEEYSDPAPEEGRKIYSDAFKKYENSKLNEAWESKEAIQFKFHPPCVQVFLNNGLLELGTLNMTAFRLAAYFKSQDETKSNTINVMNEWIENIKPEVTHNLLSNGTVDVKKIQTSVKYVVNTVFSSDRYGFSCGGMLQIPGLTEEVCTDECKNEVEAKVCVTLFDAAKVEYLGKRLYIEADAVGRRDKSYAIPKEITTKCVPLGTDKCTSCPLYETPEGFVVKVTAKTKGILNYLEPSNVPLTGKIGIMCGLPNRKTCSQWTYKVVSQNCEVIYLAPAVSNEFEDNKRYTRSTAYYFGHGLQNNQPYEFSGYTHINTKNNEIKLVLDTAEALEGSLADFVFTEEMQKASKKFRPSKTESYESKHRDIIDTLNYNYIRVWERPDMIAAIDLAYHSVNKFWFQGELIRGWLDMIILGDTRQGKSKTAETLMRHYDLGFKVSGESASRTGLLYTIPMKDGEPAYIVWGILPRQTKRLVFIDELKDLINAGGMGELTEARSSGEVGVVKTVFGKAKSETRLVMMTNAPKRKSLGTYGYPVKALLDLIPDREDISRCDFAVGVMTGQIPDSEINKNIKSVLSIPDKYPAKLCHNHILWIWNLKPDEIILSDEVEDNILKLSELMCRSYIPEIPLVEPGDFRHKLARLSTAMSARMDSRKGNKLIVNNDAVQYAFDFMNKIYKDPSLRYHDFSQAYAQYVLSPEEMDELGDTFKNMCFSWSGVDNYNDVIHRLLFDEYIRPQEFGAAVGMTAKNAKDCLVWCAARKLLETFKGGQYVKTRIGTKFFRHEAAKMGGSDEF